MLIKIEIFSAPFSAPFIFSQLVLFSSNMVAVQSRPLIVG